MFCYAKNAENGFSVATLLVDMHLIYAHLAGKELKKEILNFILSRKTEKAIVSCFYYDNKT